MFSKEIKGVERPDGASCVPVRLGLLPVHRRVAVRRVSLDRPARPCLVLRLPGPLPEGASLGLGDLLLFLVHGHRVHRPAGRDRRILHLPAPRLGLPSHRPMVPLQGAPRGAVRPDRRGGAFPGGCPGGGEGSLPGVRHPLPLPRVPPRVGGSRRSRRNDPRGVQRGGRRGVSPGGLSPLGRHARRAGAARKRLADGRYDHREGNRRGAPRGVAGRLPASRARSLRRGPDRAARLPAQGSRRARRHGRRLRRGRDGGARRDGPPGGKRDPGGKAPRDLRQREDVLRRTAPEPAGRGHPRARGESGARQSGGRRDARVRVPGAAVRRRPGFDPGGTRRGGRPAGQFAGARQGGAAERVGSLSPSHGRLDLPGGDPPHLGAPGRPERLFRPEAERPPRDDRPSRRGPSGCGSSGNSGRSATSRTGCWTSPGRSSCR